MHPVRKTSFNPASSIYDNVWRWAERKAGREYARAAEASFFLGAFGNFWAYAKSY